MWARGDLEHQYGAGHLAPWNQPNRADLLKGWVGFYPGYGPHPMPTSFTELRLDRGPTNDVMPGFGYALDPSDPATWRGYKLHQV